MGRRAFVPTAEQRKMVEALSAYGVPQDDISRIIGIAPKTLRKVFRDELDTAEIQANAKVAETLYKMATSGNVPAATFFWMKTRAGWRETDRVEITGANGGAVKVETIRRVIVDPRNPDA